MFNSWLFWALGTALIWGLGQVVVKKSLSYFSPLIYNVIAIPLYLLLLIPFALSFGVDLSKVTYLDVLLICFACGTYVLYFYAITLESVVLAGTVLSVYPLVTMFLSFIFLGERVTNAQVFWALVVILGVVLIGLKFDWRRVRLERWVRLVLLAAFSNGVGDFVGNSVVDRVGTGNFLLFYGVGFLPGVFLAYWLDRGGRKIPKMPLNLWAVSLLGIALLVLGDGMYFTAFSKGPASLVSPIASSYAAIAVFLSVIFLKERLRLLQMLGVSLTVIGIVAIGF